MIKNKSHKYIFVYQTVCETNGKTYVGVHSTNNIDDGYIGCGIYCFGSAKGKQRFHRAVRKYGYTAFRRYILSFYDTYDEALEEEKYIVNESWAKDSSNYNTALGGKGYMFAHLSKEEISDLYKGDKNHRYGKLAYNRKPVIKYDLQMNELGRYDSAHLAAIEIDDKGSNISRCCKGLYGQCGGFVYRYQVYTEKEFLELNNNLSKRKRIYNSDGSWEMTEDVKQEIRKRPPPTLGKPVSIEARQKMSQSRLGKKLKPCSEERKRKIGDANRGRKYTSDQINNFIAAKDKYAIPINVYDKFGNFVREFKSFGEAERNGFNAYLIRKNIKGKSKHYKNYIFKIKSSECK